METLLRAAVVAVALFLTGARIARADEPSEASGETAPVTSLTRPPALFGPRSGPPAEVRLSVEQDWKASFQAYPGSLTVNRELATAWGAAGADRLFVKLEAAAEASTYGFTDARRLVAGTSDPAPETLWALSATPDLYVLLDPWTLYLAPTFIFSGALDAPVGDALRYELDAAARYEVASDLKLTFGGGARTRLEARPQVYPILGVEYGRLTLALSGATLKATYAAIPDRLDVRASLGVEYRDFRLPHGSALPEGVLRDEDAPLKVGLGWKPVRGLELDLDTGAIVWRELIIDDHLGRIVAKARTHPAAFLGFQIVIDI